MEAGAQPLARRDVLVDAMPGLVALAVFLVWANEAGGFAPRAWYPGALLLGALLAVVSLTRGDLLRGHDRRVLLALGALTAFVAWSYLSIAWAQVKGDAWDGANRAALYLVVFALFALWRWTTLGRLLVLGGFSLGIAALGLWSLIDASRSADPSASYIDGNFIAPVLYRNGNAGLFLLAFWPALTLASRRELPAVLRPFFLAAAGILVELAVLPQSRGALVAFPLVLVAFFAVVPSRLRSLVFFLPVGAALALTFERLLDASEAAVAPADLARSADLAAGTVVWSAVVLLAVGAVLTAVDARLRLPPAFQRRIERAAIVVAAVVAVVVAVVAVPAVDPVARAESAWEEFTGEAEPEASDETRLLRGFDTNRPDFWRVALDEFRRHPIGGIGSENFGVPYARERESEEETLYPHSLEMGVLVQTGVVGSTFFLLFLAAGLVSAFAARSREGALDRALTSGAIVAFVYWLTHASIEWFWELPALTAPAFAFLALAAAGLRAPPSDAPARHARVLSAGIVVLAVAACVSFAFPWLAARHAAYAASAWRGDYDAAIAAVERSRRLNPLTDGADLVAGSIERRREDWDAMARAYERALERNPHSWYSHLQLALARARQGRREDAKVSLAEAKRLNPSEDLLDLVGGWLARGDPVDVTEVAEALLRRHAGVTGVERPRESVQQPG